MLQEMIEMIFIVISHKVIPDYIIKIITISLMPVCGKIVPILSCLTYDDHFFAAAYIANESFEHQEQTAIFPLPPD